MTDDALAAVLRRLDREHLVRIAGDGTIAGLTMAVVAFLEQSDDAVDVLSRSQTAEPSGARSLLAVQQVQAAVSARLNAKPEAAQVGAALYGLRIAAFRRQAFGWVEDDGSHRSAADSPSGCGDDGAVGG
ncbi:cold shock CspA family protein [Catenulispora sp. EB89]|uniref:hypothetical protein n=1 Tax=Catenulispora sp. EB89 TaxID=3156257 RepID=UPI00351583C6